MRVSANGWWGWDMGGELPPGTTFPRGLPELKHVRWPLLPARELFELEYGKSLVERDRRFGDVPVYGTNGRCGSHDQALFSGPGVILGRKGQGPLGVEWSDEDYWVIDTAYSLVPRRSDIDLKYAYFLIKFVGLNHLKDGTSNPTLSRDSFGAQAFPLPPLPQQVAIARILGELDEKICLNGRMAETLEGIARALFQSWFVDYDPVRRVIAGQDPGLPAQLAALFPTTLTQGGLPERWTMERVGDVFDIVAGNTPSTEQVNFWGGTHAWATPKDLSKLSAPILMTPARTLTDEGLRACSSGLLPVGTLFLSSRAPIGYLAFANQPTAINQGIAAFRRKNVSTSFAWAWCHANMALIVASANGSTFLEISKGVLRQLPMVQAPEPIMRAFAEIADPLVDRIVALVKQNATLGALRDTLLPRLISGELRVSDAETIAAGA